MSATDREDPLELIIIGSGPAGYTAALYASRAGLRPIVLVGAADPGGALMTTGDVENFPGFSGGIEGPLLMEEMRAQAERFGATYVYEDAVTCDLASPLKSVTQASGEVLRARAVILAMGSAYRRLGVAGETELLGRGVSWCATCDGYPYRGKDVLVVGGGDSALEEAAALDRIGARVRILHRRGEFRASRIMQDRALENPAIDIDWNSEIVEVLGSRSMTGARVRDTLSGEVRTVSAEGMFIAIGHTPRSDLVRGQLDLDADGYVIVEHPSTRTALPGVFACGDLVDRTYRQAVTAAGTGCAAALDAERHLAMQHGGRKDDARDVRAAEVTT